MASMVSLGMETARPFWIARRSAGFVSGSSPPAFTAVVISRTTRVNALDTDLLRAMMVALQAEESSHGSHSEMSDC